MNWKQPKAYAVKHKDEATRIASRSGGIFTALSDQTLLSGGVVYGCVLTESFDAVHIRAENKKERDRMRGSKYIQSKLGKTFRMVRADLEEGKNVLFSGTSCQVAGLKKFLGKDYKNLFCVDIVCHGVPSNKVWRAYLRWQERKRHSRVASVDFRNKKDFGWRDHVETLYFANGKSISSRIFTNLFYGHMILRPSCYECPYKSIVHPGDITIADYWGIEKAAPEFDDNRGVSLVLINNNKGEKILEQIKNQVICKQTKLEDSLQPPLKAPFPKPDCREEFWREFYNRPFEYIAKKYGRYGVKNNVKAFLKSVIQRLKKMVVHGGKKNTRTV